MSMQLDQAVLAVVRAYFKGNQELADFWLDAPNPFLGDLPPRHLFAERPGALLRQLGAMVGDSSACTVCAYWQGQADHWAKNHKDQVRRNAALRQRPDLPASRIPAIAEYERIIAGLYGRLDAAERMHREAAGVPE